MLLITFFVALGFAPYTHAAPIPADEKAQTVVHMLDYVSVDYPGSVHDGKVLSMSEYREQREFVTEAITLLEQLPSATDKPDLIAKARQLLAHVDTKASGTEVAALANNVRTEVIRIYKLTVAPKQAPDMVRAASLFAENCVACHGTQGHGDGPLAKSIEPSPSNFHNADRMKMRSVYGLFSTITLGVNGTPMRPFVELSEADRWGLAFYVSNLRTTSDVMIVGETLWKEGKGRSELGNLKSLVTLSPNEVEASSNNGVDLAPIQAFLLAHPNTVQDAALSPLDITRTKLSAALQAYREGDKNTARQAAIDGYLEGFELIETSLGNIDTPLKVEIEHEMMALRVAISNAQSVDTVAGQIGRINVLLDRAEERLSGGGLSLTTTFISSLLILLREGLEAILVLAAIVAFVIKTGRRDALPYIHFGWIAALVLGAVTWAIASYVLNVSGASREMTEGVTALIAAAMLLYVGYWLHSKSNTKAWQTFIRDQVNSALNRRTLWVMASVSFLAVYRELFEIILFYETLWEQAGPEGHQAVLGGIAAATVLLAIIGGVILKYSVRLPIGPFFAATSSLLAVVAVIFVGNGVAALQEAGVIEMTQIHFISLPLLGIHPTLQGIVMQGITLGIVVAGVLINRHKSH